MGLYSLYQTSVFECNSCKKVNPNAINVYSERNPKCDKKADMWVGRRAYLKDYLKSKIAPDVMIVGQSPGFLGCGFSGIPFTAEANAIADLSIRNYHLTEGKRQEEASAENVYKVLREVATLKKTTVAALSKKIIMTNAFQCIPSDVTRRVLCKEKKVLSAMSKNCIDLLTQQIEEINPRCIITLGEDALNSTMCALKIENKKKPMGILVTTEVSFETDSHIKVYPLLHPSPLTKNHIASEKSRTRFIQLLNQYL